MRIPAPDASSVELRIASLADGVYEYEFVLDGNRAAPATDPWAREITRFGGYRGLLHIRGGLEWSPPFDWSDELPPGTRLPGNNRIIIYEMPLRWMEGDTTRQVGLGTFEKVVFAHLDRLAGTGINCIELLPAQDSADTLNWGYGTRFFFAPDFDMGAAVDLKWFIKRCHQRGSSTSTWRGTGSTNTASTASGSTNSRGSTAGSSSSSSGTSRGRPSTAASPTARSSSSPKTPGHAARSSGTTRATRTGARSSTRCGTSATATTSGGGGQVVVIANAGAEGYPHYGLPWPWTGTWAERGRRAGAESLHALANRSAALSLAPFEVRVFETF